MARSIEPPHDAWLVRARHRGVDTKALFPGAMPARSERVGRREGRHGPEPAGGRELSRRVRIPKRRKAPRSSRKVSLFAGRRWTEISWTVAQRCRCAAIRGGWCSRRGEPPLSSRRDAGDTGAREEKRGGANGFGHSHFARASRPMRVRAVGRAFRRSAQRPAEVKLHTGPAWLAVGRLGNLTVRQRVRMSTRTRARTGRSRHVSARRNAANARGVRAPWGCREVAEVDGRRPALEKRARSRPQKGWNRARGQGASFLGKTTAQAVDTTPGERTDDEIRTAAEASGSGARNAKPASVSLRRWKASRVVKAVRSHEHAVETISVAARDSVHRACIGESRRRQGCQRLGSTARDGERNAPRGRPCSPPKRRDRHEPIASSIRAHVRNGAATRARADEARVLEGKTVGWHASVSDASRVARIR